MSRADRRSRGRTRVATSCRLRPRATCVIDECTRYQMAAALMHSLCASALGRSCASFIILRYMALCGDSPLGPARSAQREYRTAASGKQEHSKAMQRGNQRPARLPHEEAFVSRGIRHPDSALDAGRDHLGSLSDLFGPGLVQCCTSVTVDAAAVDRPRGC